MPKSKEHVTGPPKALGRNLLPANEILEAADALSFIFDRPEASALKKRVFEDAEAQLDFLHLKNDDAGRIAYLIQLVLRCPQFFRRSRESEWAIREFEELLVQRRFDKNKDKLFWKGMKLASKAMRAGRPGNKALDVFRYNFINDLVHPPEQLRGLVVEFNKTEAVGKLAEAEEKLFGKSPDERPIWRSYARLGRPLQKLDDRTHQESFIPPKPRKQSIALPVKSTDSTRARAAAPEGRKNLRRK